MKIGDKIKCIQDRDIYQTKGKIYEIIGIKGTEISVSVDPNLYHLICYYSIKQDKNCYMFSDYFDTLKMNRQEKLEKINTL